MITDSFHILIVFLGIIWAALFLISKFEAAKKLSPVIIILVFSAVLSNCGVLPTEHGFYNQLCKYVVSFAVCQILLGIRFVDIKKTGAGVLKAFMAAGMGSFVGCLVAGVVLRGPLDELLGGQGWKLAGPYIGTYIGGSLNFFSMWSGLEIENANLFAAANAVDNLTLIPIFMFWSFAVVWFGRWYKRGHVGEVGQLEDEKGSVVRLKLDNIVLLVFIGLAIMAVSGVIKGRIIDKLLPQIPGILVVTTLSLVAAQFKVVKKLEGAKELGNFAFYLFFAAIGAMMDIGKAVSLAPMLFFYVVIIVVVQVLFVLLVGRVFKMDIRMLAVASIAAKAGPSTVVAYTNSKNWNYLALPGVAAGLLGYAVGNYAALAGAYLLKFLLGVVWI